MEGLARRHHARTPREQRRVLREPRRAGARLADDEEAPEAPAPAPSAEDELATKILRQVEYYFSDDSYPFDDYIKSQETNGWTPLATIAAFKKMVSYTTDLDVIRSALKASDALDLDEQGDNLRRRFVTPDKLSLIHI